MGLREGIPSGDHKVGFIIELNTTTYFGEVAPPSSHKSANEKVKTKRKGLQVKTERHLLTMKM